MKFKDYVKLQEIGSSWTSSEVYRQFLLKEGINWMIMSLQEDPHTVLDLGCGDGWGTKYMMSKMPKSVIIGGDISQPKVNIAKLAGVDARYMDMHQLEGKYDVIFCSHSLEHSYDLKKALNSILDHLNHSGKLFLIVPLEPDIKEETDGSHTQVIKNESQVTDVLKERKDVVTEFKGYHFREVHEYWTIIRKI
jgi:trans-aconitate methyltransferase